jgi:magnesium transporter
MLKTLLVAADKSLKFDLSQKEIATSLEEKNCYLWLDVENPSENEIDLLAKIFRFHSLTIEECLFPSNSPKVNQYENYLFIVLQAVGAIKEDEVETSELNIFLGRNFLVTVHREKIRSIDTNYQRCKQNGNLKEKGADFLLYLITDVLLENYFPLIEEIERHSDKLEDEMLAYPTQEKLKEFFNLKRKILLLQRVVTPQRETIKALSRLNTPFIKEETKIYFRDVYEQYLRISEAVASHRDMLTNTLDIYASMISNRLNEIMKVLTAIATIAMPLTLIASLYGMNFRYMPELNWKYGYFFTLGLMAVIGTGLFVFFKKKGWF